MCAIDLLIDKVSKEQNENDKIILNEIIEDKKAICHLERKLAESNIEKARLAIQLI